MHACHSVPKLLFQHASDNGQWSKYDLKPGLVYPNSGGAFATVTTPIPLRAGANTIVIETSYLTMDWIEIS